MRIHHRVDSLRSRVQPRARERTHVRGRRERPALLRLLEQLLPEVGHLRVAVRDVDTQ